MKPHLRRPFGFSGSFALCFLLLLNACGGLPKMSVLSPAKSAQNPKSARVLPYAEESKARSPLSANADESNARPVAAPKAFPPESPADPDRRSDDEGDLTAMDLEMLAEISEKLDIELDGSENLELLAAIESWMGTPYRYGGCTRFGVDWSCLIKNLYEEVFKLDLVRTSRDMFATLPHVDREEIREGDILVFRGRRGRRIGHVGLYLKNGKFVHASRSHGVTVSDMGDTYFRKRFVAGRRVIPSKAMKLLQMLSRRDD
jgi:lipoprotein Spr/probable lipoprotein NlpC